MNKEIICYIMQQSNLVGIVLERGLVLRSMGLMYMFSREEDKPVGKLKGYDTEWHLSCKERQHYIR